MTTQHRRDVDDLASGRNDGYTEELLRERLAQPEDGAVTSCRYCDEGKICGVHPAVADRQEEPATANGRSLDAMPRLHTPDCPKSQRRSGVECACNITGDILAIEREAQGEQPAPLDVERLATILRNSIPGKNGVISPAMLAEHIAAEYALSKQPSTEPPVDGDEQRRCWTIHGPDPISQCVFFNGHEGQHWFGTTEGRWVPEGEACCGPAAQIAHVQSQGGKIHLGLGERCQDNLAAAEDQPSTEPPLSVRVNWRMESLIRYAVEVWGPEADVDPEADNASMRADLETFLDAEPSTEPAHLGFCVKVKARDRSVECNCGVAGFPSTEPAQGGKR